MTGMDTLRFRCTTRDEDSACAERESQLPKRCASVGGYNLHGGVQVSAKNRKGLEKLCRYIAGPPLAKSRLLEDGDGEYRILLKTPWSDGTSSIQVGLLELMVTERSGVGESPNEESAKRAERLEPYGRLVAIIPQPRTHQFLVHGVFAKECVRSPDSNRNPRKEVQSEAWCEIP